MKYSLLVFGLLLVIVVSAQTPMPPPPVPPAPLSTADKAAELRNIIDTLSAKYVYSSRRRGKSGMVRRGERPLTVIPFEYDLISGQFDDFIVVGKSVKLANGFPQTRFGAINRYNEQIVPYKFEYIVDPEALGSKYRIGLLDKTYRIIDNQGKAVSEERFAEYFQVPNRPEIIGLRKLGMNWRFYDMLTGKLAFASPYVGQLVKTKGYVLAQGEANYYVIDSTFVEIGTIDVDTILHKSYGRSPENPGLYQFLKKGKSGLINDAGIIRIPPMYNNVKPLYGNEQFQIGNPHTYTVGAIDVSGKVLVPQRYERVSLTNGGLLHATGVSNNQRIQNIYTLTGKAIFTEEQYEINQFDENYIYARPIIGSDGEEPLMSVYTADGKLIRETDSWVLASSKIFLRGRKPGNPLYAIYDMEGKRLTDFLYEKISGTAVRMGQERIQLVQARKQGGTMTYLNAKGEEVERPR